jgi:excisionase family DNA binding protein
VDIEASPSVFARAISVLITPESPNPTSNERPAFEPILTPEQVAERLQIKARTVYELTRRRSARPLPVLKVGKYLRFRWSEIEQWLNEGRRG